MKFQGYIFQNVLFQNIYQFLNKQTNNYANKLEYFESIKEAIKKVPISQCKKAIDSFWSRCRAIEKADGAYIFKSCKTNKR